MLKANFSLTIFINMVSIEMFSEKIHSSISYSLKICQRRLQLWKEIPLKFKFL